MMQEQTVFPVNQVQIRFRDKSAEKTWMDLDVQLVSPGGLRFHQTGTPYQIRVIKKITEEQGIEFIIHPKCDEIVRKILLSEIS